MANEYVESVAKRLLGKEVEIYFSDDHTTRNYADYEVHLKAVARGVLEEVDNCTFIVRTPKGSLAFVNSWQVTFIVDASTSVAEVLDPSKGGGRK